MNIIGQIVSEASASVVRAPKNLWLDEAEEKERDSYAPNDRKVAP